MRGSFPIAGRGYAVSLACPESLVFRRACGKCLLCLVFLLFAVPPLSVLGQSPLVPPAGTCRQSLYHGTLGPDADLRLSLVRQGDALTGFWYRESEGVYDAAANRFRHRRLELSGPLAADGGFVLTQTDPEPPTEPRVGGRVTGSFDARGALTGTWQGAAGEPALPFHLEPTDRLEQGRQPRFRLRVAAVGDDVDAERVWLSIGGRRPGAAPDRRSEIQPVGARLRATGGGTMTRFRQVTSPASGLLRSLILDSVLFGNRLKPDRLLGSVITSNGYTKRDRPSVLRFSPRQRRGISHANMPY